MENAWVSRNVKSLQSVAPKEGEILPPHEIGKCGRLNTIRNVRVEAGRIYRRICEGYVPVEDGTKLFYMLDRQSRMVETETIEARIVALEDEMVK